MDREAEELLTQLRTQRELGQQHRAALEEIASEQRQEVLGCGVDEHLLRALELAAIDLALHELTLRNMDAQIANAESAALD